MSEPFVKLYATLLESSLWWGEDETTRLVWVTLLVAADHRGIYAGTLPGLAGKARVSLEQARHAVWRLQQPDEESRTKTCDGRRIEVIEGTGYKLINYEKYRDKRSPKQIQDAAYKAAQRSREKSADTPDMSDCQTQILDLRSEILDPRSNNPSGSERETAPAAPPPAAKAAPKPRKPRTVTTLLPEDFAPNAEHATIARERGLDLPEVFANFRDWCAANGARKADWNATLRNWLRRERANHGAARGRSGGTGDVFRYAMNRIAEEEEKERSQG